MCTIVRVRIDQASVGRDGANGGRISDEFRETGPSVAQWVPGQIGLMPEHNKAAACRACEGAGPFRARPVRQKGSSSSGMIAISVGGSGVS